MQDQSKTDVTPVTDFSEPTSTTDTIGNTTTNHDDCANAAEMPQIAENLQKNLQKPNVVAQRPNKDQAVSLVEIVPMQDYVLVSGEFQLSPISIINAKLTKDDSERKMKFTVVGYGSNTKFSELGDVVLLKPEDSTKVDVPSNKKDKASIKAHVDKMTPEERRLIPLVTVVEYFLVHEYDILCKIL